ncbi:unnamed protein product [Fusarium venenatum]|uniref:WH1 domain-containing protein n=1 Tax=Fusarium venenatum TaxID=56646 RepID=A0A2L2TD57_9HYPO|nr:uncharacterized protein FVRRES_02475 [Fusarium venenatum]CEI65963.1 unnamed protein product [Fusarium venenatum]
MSRQTPRKQRHTRQPSNRIPAVSDYESDAAVIHTDYAPPPPRTNTELNLSVLQRYLPSIHTILSIAANAVIYTFNSTSESWEKSGVEGTMFVCAQSPSSEDPAQQPRACVFVLNRRGLDNVIVDLSRVSHAEVSGELVIMKVEGDWEEGDKVLGVWIHNDKDETREMNAAIIQEAWKIARSAGPVETTQGPEAGPAMQAMGRRLIENPESEESKMEDTKGKGKQKAENPISVKPEVMKPKESGSKIEMPEADVAKAKDPKGKDLKTENSENTDLKVDMPEVELPAEEKPESAGSESDINTD